MSLIPEEQLKSANGINFAPMLDFLFLMLALFATLALTRAALYDASIDLAQVKAKNNKVYSKDAQIQKVNLSVDMNGQYRWITEFNEYLLDSIHKVQEEFSNQYNSGLLPQEKENTLVLLHIDKMAPWDSVANLLFAIKEVGFDVHPIYESEQ